MAVASSTVGGSGIVAMSPCAGPPQAFWTADLSITKLTALRTFTSSNGGTSRFIVMYQVRSPELMWKLSLRSGFVRYCCSRVFGGRLAHDPSSSPDWILLKMSSVFVSIVITTPSTLFDRTSGLSVEAS